MESIRTSEFTDKAFAGCQSGDDTAARHALDHVVTIPGNEMTVIDDVLLADTNLPMLSVILTFPHTVYNTHVLPDNSAQTREPQNAGSANLICEPALSREHHLAQILRLVIFHHALRACEKSVLADGPGFVATKPESSDIAKAVGRENDFAGTCVMGHCHVPSGNELLHAEFDFTFYGYRGRHCNHCACAQRC